MYQFPNNGKRMTLLSGLDDLTLQEALASTPIIPGSVVELTNADVDTVRAHSAAGGVAQTHLALENDYAGKGIDDILPADTKLRYATVERGERALAILAASQTIQKGDKLVSNGDGSLKKYTGPTEDSGGGVTSVGDFPLFIAKETISSGVATIANVLAGTKLTTDLTRIIVEAM